MKHDKIITWLHISDAHFGGGSPTHQRIIIDKLLKEELKNRAQFSRDLETIDFLFFTGDLSYHGQTGEYQKGYKDLFQPLIEELRLDTKRVFIVPGNHEVNRNLCSDVRGKLRETFRAEQLQGKLDLRTIEDIQQLGLIRQIIYPFTPFLDFIKQYFSHVLFDTGCYRYIDKIDNLSVEIIGINTAWLAYGGKEEKGKLCLGLPFLYELLKGSSINTDLKILLMHHPFEWLSDCKDNGLSIAWDILKSNGINIVLYGHLHEEKYKPEVKEDILFIPTVALYRDDDNLQRFYYSFGVYDHSTAVARIYIRRYETVVHQFVNYPIDFPFVMPVKKKPGNIVEPAPYGISLTLPDSVIEALSEYSKHIEAPLLEHAKEKIKGYPYGEIILHTEKHFIKIEDYIAPSGAISRIQYSGYKVAPAVQLSESTSPLKDRSVEEKPLKHISEFTPKVVLSGRQQDIIRGAFVLSPISGSLLVDLISRMRKEKKEDVEKTFEELLKLEIFEYKEEKFPFTGENTGYIKLKDEIENWITQPDNLSDKDKWDILNTAIDLIGIENLDGLRLLFLLLDKRKVLSPNHINRIKEYISSQSEKPVHPTLIFVALAFIEDKNILIKLASQAPTQNIIRTHLPYANALSEYMEIVKKAGQLGIFKQCAERSIELYSIAFEHEEDDITKASVLIKRATVYETLDNLLKARKEYNNAISYLLQAVEKIEEPEQKAGAWEAMGDIRREKLKDYDGAIGAYRKGLEFKARWGLWAKVAFSLEEQAKEIEARKEDASSKWKEAMDHHLQAVEKIEEPERKAGAWLTIAHIRREKLKEEGGAVDAYRKCVDYLLQAVEKIEEPEQKAGAWLRIAEIWLRKLEDPSEALEVLKKAKLIDKNEINALILSIRAYSKLGKDMEANSLLSILEGQLLYERAPQDVVQRRRAWVNLRKGMIEEAMKIAKYIQTESEMEKQRITTILALSHYLFGRETVCSEKIDSMGRVSEEVLWDAIEDAITVTKRFFPQKDIQQYLKSLEKIK